MKSDAERGRWGRFLREQRTKRGLSQEQVRERLRGRGFAVGESSYAEWESGYKQPTKEAQQQFRDLWKAEPAPEPVAPEPQSGEFDSLIRAIGELVAEMRLAREEGPVWAQAVVSAVLAGRQLGSRATEHDEPRESGVPRRGQ